MEISIASDGPRARKGDLVLVRTASHNFYSTAALMEAKAAGRELKAEDTAYTFGVVASATRDGVVKTWCAVGCGNDLVNTYAQPVGTSMCWVTSSKKIDVPGVLSAAKKHHWDNHPGQPEPFTSLEDAVSVARPFLVKSGQ